MSLSLCSLASFEPSWCCSINFHHTREGLSQTHPFSRIAIASRSRCNFHVKGHALATCHRQLYDAISSIVSLSFDKVCTIVLSSQLSPHAPWSSQRPFRCDLLLVATMQCHIRSAISLSVDEFLTIGKSSQLSSCAMMQLKTMPLRSAIDSNAMPLVAPPCLPPCFLTCDSCAIPQRPRLC